MQKKLLVCVKQLFMLATNEKKNRGHPQAVHVDQAFSPFK